MTALMLLRLRQSTQTDCTCFCNPIWGGSSRSAGSVFCQDSPLTIYKQDNVERNERRPNASVEDGLYYYPQRRIEIAGAIISALLSAILLIGTIVCLLLTSNRNMHLRVGMVVLFTCLFAIVVGLLTNARRAEIFGATAAYVSLLISQAVRCFLDIRQQLIRSSDRYAAVLVVFVSNNLGQHSRSATENDSSSRI